MRPHRALLVAFALAAACGLEGTQLAAQSPATLKRAVLGDSAVVVRRIAVDSGNFFYPLGPPTRDGRYFSGVDAKTGNLAVRDLRTGERRLLTTTAGWSDGYVESSTISPNGRTVAFRWTVIQPTYAYELRTIGMDGAGERTLVKTGDLSEYSEPADWSPDGRSLLAIMYRKDKSRQIAFISSTDGSVRVLKSMDWRSPRGLKFSPDGRWVAYDFQSDQDDVARDVFVLQVDGSRETRITKDGVPKVLVGWSPDGLGLFYSTRKANATTIWYAPVREGRPAGAPKVVRSDIWGATVVGLSGAALYYNVSDLMQTVYSVALDIEAGRALAPPAPIIAGSDLSTIGPAIWAPDGNYVAFVRSPGPTGTGRAAIAIHHVSTGEERQIPLAVEWPSLLNWLPDGRAIITLGNRRGQRGRYRVDLATGHAQLIDQLDASTQIPVLAPDGKTEYFVRRERSFDSSIVIARSIETHQEVELYRGRGAGDLQRSPDGANLAFIVTELRKSDAKETAKLVMIPASGGEPKVLLAPDLPSFIGGGSLNWTPDGRHVLVRVGSLAGGDDELWKATPRTGEAKMLLSAKDMIRPRVSPDGRRVVWIARTGGKTNELWVMENLPGSGTKAASGSR